MTFQEIKELSGMSLRELSEYFGIPYRTIQNWSEGQRSAPDYVLKLMKFKLENDSERNATTEEGSNLEQISTKAKKTKK